MSTAQFNQGRSDTPDRRERPEIYNGELQPPVASATGFRDEIEPVDETIESMSTAAATSHKADETLSATNAEGSSNIIDAPTDTAIQNTTENGEEDEDRGIIVNAKDMPDDLAPKKRKKKKSKPASKRGMVGIPPVTDSIDCQADHHNSQNKPTGFEDNYADAPLTVEQMAEQKEIYDPELPFVDRALTAIQRFERTRKMSNERRDVFYKYLAYGGVDVGPNMFQGGQDTKEMNKDDITTTMAQTSISEDTKASIVDPKRPSEETEEDQELSIDPIADLGPPEHFLPEHSAKYTVDFLATMKAFLSYRAPTAFAFETRDRVDIVTTTLERFMDYLMQNDVAPEYTNEILSARNLCRIARTELWNCAEAQRWLPGDFNIACSTLFGGQYRDYDGETYWADPQPGESVFVGLTAEKATQIVGFAIAGTASEEVYSQYHNIHHNQEGKFEIVGTIRDHGFEITKIEEPSPSCLELYKENTSEYRPVGTIYTKFWPNPSAPPEDLTPAEKVSLKGNKVINPNMGRRFTFFVESTTILPVLQVGQKIEATIHKLNCGVWFFDEFIRIYPTFTTWIENEMTYGWKEPKPLKGSIEFDLEEAARRAQDLEYQQAQQDLTIPDHHNDAANAVAAVDDDHDGKLLHHQNASIQSNGDDVDGRITNGENDMGDDEMPY